MSHANRTGGTQKDQILKISFGQVHFSKKGQNTKKNLLPSLPLSLSHALNASATAATTSHHHATPPMLSLL
jgi:hypothetical protein